MDKLVSQDQRNEIGKPVLTGLGRRTALPRIGGAAPSHSGVHGKRHLRSIGQPVASLANAGLTRSDAARAERTSADRPVGGLPKRLLDIAVAAPALLLMLPVILTVAALVWLTSRGPVLYGHPRLGYGGHIFTCYKFRTMHDDADHLLHAHLADHPEAAREWTSNQKLRNDPRITPLGQVLRKTSLDELPQLVNVLRGDMSCVGPRPIVAEELKHYGRHVQDYFSVRPGMTGAWQVSGRSRVGYKDRVRLDVEYVRNWSLATDLRILARTSVIVFRVRDAC